ncbi:PH domain-containing protein [Candidatus Palauibacter sp.]|uniref:PH domain-containing protein n=1 Tax=Candidatus Palauibacter sp. TaxID=3101350 RepID=UPI003B02E446
MAADGGDPGPAEDPAPTEDAAPAEREASPSFFLNGEVPLDALPGAETVDWLPLHSRFARRLQVGAVIRSVACVAAAGGLHLLVSARNPGVISGPLPWLPPLLWTVLGVFCVWSVLWPLVAVPRRGYVVREKDLLYKSGVLWRSVKAFPFNRVQHTKLHSTPLDRRFGLASLSVFPAGGGLGNRVHGLGRQTAEQLRVYISERMESAASPAADSDERSEASGNAGR